MVQHLLLKTKHNNNLNCIIARCYFYLEENKRLYIESHSLTETLEFVTLYFERQIHNSDHSDFKHGK